MTRPALRALPWIAATLVGGASLLAQEEVRPELRGRVLLGDAPLPDARVVLHRVSADTAGEIDSLVAGPEGAFTFELPSMPDEGGNVIYFASVRHQGILYFGRPVARPVQLDSLYEIRTWDTIPAPEGGVRLPIAVRYLVLDQVADGWTVTELFEFEVPPEGTLVPAPGSPTWSHPLPEGARDAQAGGGVDPAGPQVRDGRLGLTSPISPGPRQFLVSYTIDELDGLRIPVPDPVAELELLVREPATVQSVSGLEPIESVEMEPGVEYRRFGGSLAGDTALVLTVGAAPRGLPLRWIAVGLGLVLALAGLWAVGRVKSGDQAVATPAPTAGEATVPIGDSRDRILLEIARLDERLAAEDAPDEAERERLRAERRDLLARLRGGG